MRRRIEHRRAPAAIAGQIKARVSVTDALAVYAGLTPGRNNKCKCPLHSEDTASFTVYPDTRSFYCFGCGAGGDVIRFAALYLHVSAFEAMRDLNDRFHLDLLGNRGAKTNAACVQALNANRQRQHKIAAWEARLEEASAEVRKFRRALDALPRPRTPEEGGAYGQATARLERSEELFQMLLDERRASLKNAI